MEYNNNLIQTDATYESASSPRDMNLFNKGFLKPKFPFWEPEADDISLGISIRSKKIYKLRTDPKFRYLPFPSDGYCLIQAELYLKFGRIFPDPVKEMQSWTDCYPEWKALSQADIHCQNLRMSRYKIPVISNLRSLSTMVVAYEGHMYYCPLLVRNPRKSHANEDYCVGSWGNRPLQFGFSYAYLKGTSPTRQSTTPLVTEEDDILCRPNGILVNEKIFLDPITNEEKKRYIYVPPSNANMCVPIAIAIQKAVTCDFEHPEVGSSVIELLSSEDKVECAVLQSLIAGALQFPKNKTHGMELKEAVEFANDHGIQVLTNEDYKNGVPGLYFYDDQNPDSMIHAIYVATINLNFVTSKSKEPLYWCAKDALVASGIISKNSSEFEDFVSLTRRFSGEHDHFVKDVELAWYLMRKNVNFVISSRSPKNLEYDTAMMGSAQKGSKPMYNFLCVSSEGDIFNMEKEGNHWIYVPETVLYMTGQSRRPSISKKADLYTPPSKNSLDTKKSLTKIPEFEKIVDIPDVRKQCYVDLENNIIYPFLPFAQKSGDKVRHELRAMNPKFYEELIENERHFDVPEPFFIAKLLKLLSNLEDEEWTIAGGFYGETHYMIPKSKSYAPGETWMMNKKYREIYKEIPSTMMTDYVLAPLSLHSDKFNIPVANTKKCYAIIFEINRYSQGVLSFDEPSMGIEYYATADVDYFHHPNDLGKCRSHILKKLPLKFEFDVQFHKGIKYTSIAREVLADDIRLTLCRLEAVLPDFSNCLNQVVDKSTINSIIPRRSWRDVWDLDFLGLYSDIKLPTTRDPTHVAAITDYLNMKSANDAAKQNLSQALLLSNGYRSVMNNQAKGITSQQVGLFMEVYINNLEQQKRLEDDEEPFTDKVVRKAGLYVAKGVLAVYRYGRAAVSYVMNHTGGYEAWRNAAIIVTGGWYVKRKLVGGRFGGELKTKTKSYYQGFTRGLLCAAIGLWVYHYRETAAKEITNIAGKLKQSHPLMDVMLGGVTALLHGARKLARDWLPKVVETAVVTKTNHSEVDLEPAKKALLDTIGRALQSIGEINDYDVVVNITKKVGGPIKIASNLKIQSYLTQIAKYKTNATPSVPMAFAKRAELDRYDIGKAISLENPSFHINKYGSPVSFGEWIGHMAKKPPKLTPQEPEYVGYARQNLFPSVQGGSCPSTRLV